MFEQSKRVLISYVERQCKVDTMLDFETGVELWRLCWPEDHQEYFTNRTLLTDFLYAYIYVCSLDPQGNEIFSGLKVERNVMLRLLDAKTGKEVFHGECWRLWWLITCVESHPDPRLEAIAGEDVLCVTKALNGVG